ncbi:flavin prenyltransferase UbiX [Geobacter grbiciae]|uniref:flavin prenyltransferase UbiX n=1 Tax=Geobacter grbiciae TaxID=155042 RepID=UPI001C01BE3D|nr:flavin prenyltransferase UbiX [Geobacter grbiciae]MBT1074084.1 UbiX family flavin prenyltransferase [Geobacter grbiciae]
MSGTVLVGITGASGSVYGLRLCEELLRAGKRVVVTASGAGIGVVREETNLDLSAGEEDAAARLRELFGASPEQLSFYGADNLFAPPASGSAAPDAMVVAPCSMGTLARIATGLSSTLLERCADVMVKEGRPLVIVPRETPLSAIHLENMLKLARLGVRVVPAMPAFYHRPKTLDDLVDFVVGKVLDTLGVHHELFARWGVKAGTRD